MKGKYMNTKKLRRQCMVPGCRCLDTYLIHKGREPWAKVIICKDCLKGAYDALFPEEKDVKIAGISGEKDATTPEKTGENEGKITEISKPKKTTAKKTEV